MNGGQIGQQALPYRLKNDNTSTDIDESNPWRIPFLCLNKRFRQNETNSLSSFVLFRLLNE